MHADAKDSLPTKTSERVVVDEIFDNGTVRLLRARRNKAHLDDPGLGIKTWGKEKEEIWKSEDAELFVGFPPGRRLQEGDVFFIKDGSIFKKKLIKQYRKRPPSSPLLMGLNESRRKARDEIKEEFYNLTALQIAKNAETFESLKKQVSKKIAGEIEKS